jgi:phenylpropionate dioxygenase-like ring-hydroxylating dioxygenase large terminal subunit
VWIPIALSRDVPPGVTRAVILDGAERVVWRAEDGRVQVWEDRCPHRGMRLSFGFVRGNALNCLYHGWQYAAAAHCVHIPAHPDLDVPSTIRAKAFPAADAGGMIWTRQSGDTPLPALPPALPLASVAVDASDEAILALCRATPQGTAQIVAADLDGIAFTLGWHAVSPHRTMLHAAVVGAPADSAALAALRRLRQRAEMRQAA